MTYNYEAVRDETTKYLQELIRINTTNPPGNETAAAEYLAGVFKREGIESTILESAPGRGNIVARLKGDGRAAPLMLMFHLDVVPAEADKWEHPPFSGDIADGFLWGRGTLDTKGLGASELMIMLLLKREGKPLARDIIFMANADEEAGGHMGAGWMVKNHPDLIRAEYAINEGGGFALEAFGKRFFTCQTAMKGTARFTMRARGRPGHASQSHPNNAVLKLADAIKKIGEAEFPLHATDTMKLFVEQIAEYTGKSRNGELLGLLDAKKYRSTIQHLGMDDGLAVMFNAMLRNTVTPTILSAGSKVNVIPSVAEAQCDARILPGQTQESFHRELRAVIGNDIEVEFANGATQPVEADYRSPLFDTISRVMAQHEPNAPVIPYLSTGATDARHVSKLGTQVLGFCPIRSSMSELDRVHAHNERVAVEEIGFATQVLYQVVSEFAGKA